MQKSDSRVKPRCKDLNADLAFQDGVGAASFLGLTSNDPQHVEDRRKATRTAIENAISWLKETKADTFRSGVSGGEEAISKSSLSKLMEFLEVIEGRFANQIEAIKRTKR
jgi:hypothetical protein